MIQIDIPMPKMCYGCPCHDGENNKCQITDKYYFDEIPRSCPLKEVRSIGEDLIRRSDVINLLWYFQDECCSAVVGDFEKLPSADRPQGEWIYCEDEYGIDGYRCSNCGKHIPWDYQHKFIGFIDDYHTCPFCDARMKGADDE